MIAQSLYLNVCHLESNQTLVKGNSHEYSQVCFPLKKKTKCLGREREDSEIFLIRYNAKNKNLKTSYSIELLIFKLKFDVFVNRPRALWLLID